MERINVIDNLRGIAVLAVVLYHVFPKYFSGGFYGVDIFFVISGYVITSKIENSRTSGNFFEFYKLRIIRLFPSLIIVLYVVFLVSWFTLYEDEFIQINKHIFGSSIFINNFLLLGEAGYFDKLSEKKPLLNLWSLGLEFQFYLFSSIVLYFIRSRSVKFFIILTTFIISVLFYIYVIEIDKLRAFYLPTYRIFEYLSGCLLALGQIYMGRKNFISRKLLFFGLLLIVYSIFFLTKENFPNLHIFIPLFGTILIILTNRTNDFKIVNNKLNLFFGRISYSLYLWHWPILTFALIFFEKIYLFDKLIIIIISVILAYICTILELYLKQKKIRFTISILLFLMIFISIITYSIYLQKNGLMRERFKIYDVNMSVFDEKKNIINDGCENLPKNLNENFCIISDKKYNKTIMYLGDSHLNAIAPALLEAHNRIGKYNIKIIGMAGCTPFINTETFANGAKSFGCRSVFDAAIREAENDPNISKVVLVGRFSTRYDPFYFQNTNPIKYKPELNNTVDTKRDFILGLEETVHVLKEAGKEVVILLQIPEIPASIDPRKCISAIPFRDKSNCTFDERSVIQTFNNYESAIAKISYKEGITLIDTRNFFCNNSKCNVVIDNKLMYHDNDHISSIGAKDIVERYFKELL